VTGDERGAFSLVAEATRSAKFDTTTVSELWASLPGFPTPRAIIGERPRCLTLEAVRSADDERPVFERIAVPIHGIFGYGVDDPTSLPADYPTTHGIEESGTQTDVLGGTQQIVSFRNDDGGPRPLHDVGRREGGLQGKFIVRPKVGTEAVGPPSEYLTLWALLFCLSDLARYYPDTWVAALDPDRSVAAVTLEEGLDIALERAPTLIAQALRGPIDELIREEAERLRAEAEASVGDEDQATPAAATDS
jgi:hypothetical protein